MTEETTCDICDTAFNIDKYGVGFCSGCGQKHAWEEQYMPVLTEDQKAELLKGSITLKLNKLIEDLEKDKACISSGRSCNCPHEFFRTENRGYPAYTISEFVRLLKEAMV